MELENSTILSILVGLAGVLAELIFHNTLSSSVIGMVLGVVLAVIILCCTYFALDGMGYSLSSARKKEERRKREYDEKIYRLLDKRLGEQVKLEKAIYSRLSKGLSNGSTTGVQGTQLSPEALRELAEQIDESTTKAAKMVARYSQKGQEVTDKILEDIIKEVLQSLTDIATEIKRLGEQLDGLAAAAATAAAVPQVALPPELEAELAEEAVADGVAESGASAVEEALVPGEISEQADKLAAEDMLPADREPAAQGMTEPSEKTIEEMTAELFGAAEAAAENGIPKEEPVIPVPAPDDSNPELSADEIAQLFAMAESAENISTEAVDSRLVGEAAEAEEPGEEVSEPEDFSEQETVVVNISGEKKQEVALPDEVEALLAAGSILSGEAEPEAAGAAEEASAENREGNQEEVPEAEAVSGSAPVSQPETVSATEPTQASEPAGEPARGMTALDLLRQRQQEHEAREAQEQALPAAESVLSGEAETEAAGAVKEVAENSEDTSGDMMSPDDIAALIASMNP